MADWRRPDASGPALRREEVHVWRAPLDSLSADARSHLWRMLAEDEIARAGRFRLPLHRARFAAAHGWLRLILGRYLDSEPASLRFRHLERGKPVLEHRTDVAPLSFNLSHADGLALVVVAREREVGVDIERVRSDDPWRASAFLRAWTRKEAYLKAIGTGLTGSPDASFDPGWQVLDVDPHPDYAAAVAAQGVDWQLRCWECWAPSIS